MKSFLTCFIAIGLMSMPAWAQDKFYTYVDPFIGSAGLGHIFIGPSCPFGMVKPGPDCNRHANSGYDVNRDVPIYGFSQLHVSGTGGGPKYGNITIMPFAGDFDSTKQTSPRGDEIAKTGYYSVVLKKWNIKAELTTSSKVAFYRFVFKGSTQKAIKLDPGDFLGESMDPDGREAQKFVGSEIKIISDNEIQGYSRVRGGWNNGAAYTVYFAAVFEHPFSKYTTWKKNIRYSHSPIQVDTGDKTGAMVFFEKLMSDTLQVKIGISFISSSKARQNITNEINHWSFEETLKQTQNKWEDLLRRIEVDKATSVEQKTMFYTALYHTMLMPVDRTGENPLWKSNAPYYDDFYAIWDTFRSSNPLITLIAPSKEVDIVNSLLDIYHYDGYMPDARSGNYNGRTQGGSNAEVLLADAYVKGLTGIDYNTGLEAMLKDATAPPGGNEEKEGRGGLTDYNSLGYVSTNFVRAGNRTVEYAYNDYCIAEVAQGLNKKEVFQKFDKQSNNWLNLWRPYENHGAKGFIMPRDASGKWVDTINCTVINGPYLELSFNPLTKDYPACVCWWCGFFYEANSWEYSLYVPHDVATLIKQSGGQDAFRRRLDTLFIKRYYNVKNEPSFLTPNLYHWIGRPDLSNKRILGIIDENYNTSASGLPGNDDSGAMSSWLDFHMIGLFPNAGQSYYLINAPYFKQTTLHLENGKHFKIIAKNLSEKKRSIKAVWLNGKTLNQSWIEHKDIFNGGELIIEMDTSPSTWGSENLPPSKSIAFKS